MTVDPDEMFIFELSIALKIPSFEIKQWPIQIIDEYRALNIVRPFTERAQAIREGYFIELFRNRNVTKEKDWVSKEKLFPYLGDSLPDFIEHPLVKKAVEQIGLAKRLGHKYMLEDTLKRMEEQIQIENAKPEHDMYLIRRYVQLIRENQSGA